MFKQVFGKLFFGNSTNNSGDSFNNSKSSVSTNTNRAPIYSIPSISSSFVQQQSSSNSVPPCLTSYNNDNENKISNKQESSLSNNISASSSFSSASISNNKQAKSVSSLFNNLKFSSISVNKFSDASTRQIYIAPHCIKYTNSTLDDTIYRIDDESLNEIAVEILESDNMPPKLQIVYHLGSYYSINNSHLQIYKQLQLSGLITHVQADVISVEAIPVALRDHLLQPIQSNGSSNNSNEISDEDEEDEYNTYEMTDPSKLNTNDLTNIGLADVISPACIEMLSKDLLIDETYEFGACENCVESDSEQKNENNIVGGTSSKNASQFAINPRYQRKQLHLNKQAKESDQQQVSSSGCSSNSSRNESRTDYEDDDYVDDDDEDDDDDDEDDELDDQQSIDEDDDDDLDYEEEEYQHDDYRDNQMDLNENSSTLKNNSNKINMSTLSNWTKKLKINNETINTKCKYELTSTKIPTNDLVLQGESEEIIDETLFSKDLNKFNRRRQSNKDKTRSNLLSKMIPSNDTMLAIDETETDSLMSRNDNNIKKYNPNDINTDVSESKF